MKNLFTLLLLVVSFLAVGQTNNTSEEIKYWKSIADSNDTVAYRQYLNRYGETGLYYDEAITRIALLKSSGKQVQSKSIECCFYTEYRTCSDCAEYVVKFDSNHSNHDKVWFKRTNYDTIRSNLAVSRDFYENQAAVHTLRCCMKGVNIIGKITDSNKNVLPGATILATHTPSGSKYNSKADANGNYRLELPNRGTYKIEYRMVGFQAVIQVGITATDDESKILNVCLNKKSPNLSHVIAEAIQDEGNVWTTVKDTWTADEDVWTTSEEYEYDPMKSTSARDVYSKRDELYEIHYNGEKSYRKVFYVYPNDIRFNGKFYEKQIDYYKHKDDRYDFEIKTMQGYRYVAFSKDKSSFIMWFEEDKNLDGQVFEKTNYYRVPKEELLPKKVNYDFLNK